MQHFYIRKVAPLAGSVDRNSAPSSSSYKGTKSLPSRGAWIEIASGPWTARCPRTSLPSRGAWIEIRGMSIENLRKMSLPSRGAWIEIQAAGCRLERTGSLPSRGAWIEMAYSKLADLYTIVAPLAGSVDRNHAVGDVDRVATGVAPLAGSVDRNPAAGAAGHAPDTSLPSRGAWIEMV